MNGVKEERMATAQRDRAIERLAGSLEGELIAPGDAAYDEARRIWNGAIDRRPACIARCTGVADVVAAVRFARERDLLVAVRSGGHGVGGHSLCEGGPRDRPLADEGDPG
jgi:FAD/FMN-containing dehydrogenase